MRNSGPMHCSARWSGTVKLAQEPGRSLSPSMGSGVCESPLAGRLSPVHKTRGCDRLPPQVPSEAKQGLRRTRSRDAAHTLYKVDAVLAEASARKGATQR